MNNIKTEAKICLFNRTVKFEKVKYKFRILIIETIIRQEFITSSKKKKKLNIRNLIRTQTKI